MGFFNEFCRGEETRTLNSKLFDMYEAWHDTWKDKTSNISKYNHPQLLTCTDEYLNKRIMMFGKEANYTKEESGWLVVGKAVYQSDSYWYQYDNDILDDKAKLTKYLQTRKLISGIKNYNEKNMKKDEIDRRLFSSLICNNLNKTSLSGGYTGVDEVHELYIPFLYNGFRGTVYQHEFRILKPQKVVICCGKGYYSHMNRDFDMNSDGSKLFWDEINGISFDNFGIAKSKKPVVKLEMSQGIKEKIFGYKNVDVLCCMHPSAHMNHEKRKEYENEIRYFLNN